MAFKKGNAWGVKSKLEGIQMSNRHHVCLDCRYHQTEIYKVCPECDSKNRQYFMSDAEFYRGMTLITLQTAGSISNLRFQPRYELNVNGRLIATYVADAEYRKDGVVIFEDTKPSKFMDKSAELKIKLFEAIYNVVVTIPQRKSGNRT